MGIRAAQNAMAVRQDLAEQRLAHRAQIDQVDRPAQCFGQITDEVHLLARAECPRSLHTNVQITVIAGRAPRHGPEHKRQLQAAVSLQRALDSCGVGVIHGDAMVAAAARKVPRHAPAAA